MKIDYVGLVENFSSINRDLNFKGSGILRAAGVTKTEAIYLRIIWYNSEITQYSIAKLKNCSKNLVIKHIGSLEKKGYLKKVPIDNMRKQIVLTSKGEKVIKHTLSCLQETGEEMFKGYTKEEIEIYLKMSFTIKKNLQESVNRNHFKNDGNFKKYE